MPYRSMSLVIILLLAACSKGEDRISAKEAKSLVENRNWLDKWPTDENERLYVYRFTPQMGGGVYQDRTLFAGRFELFNYKLATKEIEIRWPDRGKSETVQYRIESVSGPKPFDLKLSLKGTTVGPTVFYGMRKETAIAAKHPWFQSLR